MFILDTNVVSELRKIHLGKAHPHVARWANNVNVTELYLSVITIQELEMGVLLIERKDPAQGTLFRTWLNQHVLPTFAGRIFPIAAFLGAIRNIFSEENESFFSF